MNQHDKPCKGCPFSRSVKAGELGGSPVSTYIGQAVGPFFLPCHAVKTYRGKATTLGTSAQCAGAAIYRANVGVSDKMPDPLLKLPVDTSTVFASHGELVAHHLEISPDAGERLMSGINPNTLCRIEMEKAGVRVEEVCRRKS